MTEENNHDKTPKYSDQLVQYNLGNGDYFLIIPTPKGLHCWGKVAGDHYQMVSKDFNELQHNLSDSLTKSQINHLNSANRCEEISLRIKENGLEKTSKDLGGDKQ